MGVDAGRYYAARTLLDYVKAELLVMDNSIPRARLLILLHDGYIRLLEISELEARIAALEAMKK